MTYILDACALMAVFKQENGTDKVKSLLNEAQAGQATVYMNIINLIETFDDVIFSETSRIKATCAIPLGDAIGLATAIKLGGSFVTGDHSDIEKIEKVESVSIFWFR